MLKARLFHHKLLFKQPGGTSRGVLTSKMSWYFQVWHHENPSVTGLGECSVLPGLSPDDRPGLEEQLQWCCDHMDEVASDLQVVLNDWPAIRFAIEMALLDLNQGGRRVLFPSSFTGGKSSIPINGLIWMGPVREMSRRIEEKLANGFHCLKLKIGALTFAEEVALLKQLRERFPANDLELRVDANGGFTPEQAPRVLEQLADLAIHSIEQPIKAGQWEAMAALCRTTPLPIALDEELIGLQDVVVREKMLETIRPQYIIIKPSLTGGFLSSQNWIDLAGKNHTRWWITSALEGNVGLNAIAQWTATLNNEMPQGLGTGQVFTNNLLSPLEVVHDRLMFTYRADLESQYFNLPE